MSFILATKSVGRRLRLLKAELPRFCRSRWQGQVPFEKAGANCVCSSFVGRVGAAQDSVRGQVKPPLPTSRRRFVVRERGLFS